MSIYAHCLLNKNLIITNKNIFFKKQILVTFLSEDFKIDKKSLK